MSLIATFITTQLFGKCGCFTFEDSTKPYSLTNPHGYGTPNIDKTDVTKTEIYITTVNGTKYKVNRNYKPNLMKITICTNDFVEFEETVTEHVDSGCGCTKTVPVYQPSVCPPIPQVLNCETTPNHGNIKDGCIFIEYYVFANTSVKRVCDYTVTDINLQSGQKLWVSKNGILVDVTTLIASGIFTVSQTNDVYTDWFVKTGNTVDVTGNMVRSNCNNVSLATPEEVIVSAYMRNEIFVCNTEKRLSELSFKITVEDGQCTNCIQNGISSEQKNSLVAIAWSKLNVIKDNPGCNCKCINDNIKQINNIIDKIYGNC